MSDADLTDEELARELAAVDNWSEERLAAAQKVTEEVLELTTRPDGEKEIAGLAAAGRPMRDWIILTARRMADREAARHRRGAGRTRTSPVDPCEDYDPSEFWKAFDGFKAAIVALESRDGAAGRAARAGAAVAFRGGPLPADLAEPERSLVAAADEALFRVRTVLSIPGAPGGSPGGRKCLETDLWNLEHALREFEERAAFKRPGGNE